MTSGCWIEPALATLEVIATLEMMTLQDRDVQMPTVCHVARAEEGQRRGSQSTRCQDPASEKRLGRARGVGRACSDECSPSGPGRIKEKCKRRWPAAELHSLALSMSTAFAEAFQQSNACASFDALCLLFIMAWQCQSGVGSPD